MIKILSMNFSSNGASQETPVLSLIKSIAVEWTVNNGKISAQKIMLFTMEDSK